MLVYLKSFLHTLGAVGSRRCGARGAVGGFCALLNGLTSVVDNSSRSRDSNPQPWVTSPTLYPLEPRLPHRATTAPPYTEPIYNMTKLGYIYFHMKYFNTPLDMTLSATCVDLFGKKAWLLPLVCICILLPFNNLFSAFVNFVSLDICLTKVKLCLHLSLDFALEVICWTVYTLLNFN